MAFDKTWTEASPAGTDNLASGDDEIRETRYALRERLAIEHKFYASEVGETNVGRHFQVGMVVSAADPGVDATLGFMYLKTIGGVLELFYEDSAGNVLQMTSAGSLVGTTAFRTGDFILCETTDARAGWTDMSATYEDKFIRLSSGTPLDTGGANTHTHAAGTFASANHTHSGTTSTNTGTKYDGDAGNSSITHSHTFVTSSAGAATITGTSASANNIPAYVQMVLWRKD